jgi:hypothetical protein
MMIKYFYNAYFLKQMEYIHFRMWYIHVQIVKHTGIGQHITAITIRRVKSV